MVPPAAMCRVRDRQTRTSSECLTLLSGVGVVLSHSAAAANRTRDIPTRPRFPGSRRHPRNMYLPVAYRRRLASGSHPYYTRRGTTRTTAGTKVPPRSRLVSRGNFEIPTCALKERRSASELTGPWSHLWVSNPAPRPYQGRALPNELRRREIRALPRRATPSKALRGTWSNSVRCVAMRCVAGRGHAEGDKSIPVRCHT